MCLLSEYRLFPRFSGFSEEDVGIKGIPEQTYCGTGLFMGSVKTLAVSGTSIILTYLIIGFFFFFVMRAMGELLLSNTNYKSFADFATAYLGPWAGFFLGWSYWLSWIVTAIADVIVIGGYAQFWYPDLPAWIPAFTSIAILTLLNFDSWFYDFLKLYKLK